MDVRAFLSINIAARNEIDTIGQTINAITKSSAWQSASRREILILVNGSTDGTGELVRTLAEKNSAIRYFEVARGSKGAAWNSLVARSSSEAENLIFMDADVIADPQAFECMLNRLNSDPSVDLVGALPVPASSKDIKYSWFHRQLAEFLRHDVILARRIREKFVAGCCFAIRRESAVKIRIPEEPVAGDDYALNAYFHDRRVVIGDAKVFFIPPNFWDRMRVSARYRRRNLLFKTLYPDLFDRLELSLIGANKKRLGHDFLQLPFNFQVVAIITYLGAVVGAIWGKFTPIRGRASWSIPRSTKFRIKAD